jgi:nucleotide-binding universal stress UspA family protein
MYDTILVPTDGSAGSRKALEHAVDLAKTNDAAIHVLSVVDVTALAAVEGNVGPMLDAFEETGNRVVSEAVERVESEGIEAVEGSVGDGQPYRVILDYADEHGVDLIVMGTHGRTGLDRYLVGSVTEKVVRLADVPVLTIRADESESREA